MAMTPKHKGNKLESGFQKLASIRKIQKHGVKITIKYCIVYCIVYRYLYRAYHGVSQTKALSVHLNSWKKVRLKAREATKEEQRE